MDNYFFLFLVLFCTFFCVVSFSYEPNTNDFWFHYAKSSGNYSLVYWTGGSLIAYPPLVSWISSLFVSSSHLYWLFWCSLICLFPVFVFLLFKNRFVLLSLFCVPFLYSVVFASLFAQFLVSVFWLLEIYFLSRKQFLFLPFLACFMFLTHNMGFYLFLVTLFVYLGYSFFQKHISFLSVVFLNNSKGVFLLHPFVSLFKFIALPLLFLLPRKLDWIQVLFWLLLGIGIFVEPRILLSSSLLLAVLIAPQIEKYAVNPFYLNILYVVLLFQWIVMLLF